jgi:hypothetical protein
MSAANFISSRIKARNSSATQRARCNRLLHSIKVIIFRRSSLARCLEVDATRLTGDFRRFEPRADSFGGAACGADEETVFPFAPKEVLGFFAGVSMNSALFYVRFFCYRQPLFRPDECHRPDIVFVAGFERHSQPVNSRII